MPIFNTKQKAKTRARELASQYNIQYNKDGNSYSIYDKEGLSTDPGRSAEMLGVDQRPIGRRKQRLLNRYFQVEAEKHNLEEIRQQRAEEKDAALLLQKKLDDETVKSGPGTVGPVTSGPDDIVTEMPFNYSKFKLNNFDLSSKSKTFFPTTNSSLTTTTNTNKDQIDPNKVSGFGDMIQSSDIYDITSLNPFSNLLGISHADFIKAKNEGKSYLVNDNEVYDVNQNLMSYDSKPDNWSARESDNYYRTQAIGNTLGGIRNVPPTLTKGKRNKWFEVPNLLEQTSVTGAPIKVYGRILRELGPTLSKLLKNMNKTNPKEVQKIVKLSEKALREGPEPFKKIIKKTKDLLTSKITKKIVKKPSISNTVTKKKLVSKTKKPYSKIKTYEKPKPYNKIKTYSKVKKVKGKSKKLIAK